MDIEKKIYYCWFGKGEKSAATQAYINGWADIMPDYEIIEINETNFDISVLPYAQSAYDAKRYAFVSDCARVFYLQKYGGIYLDTDVEVRKDLTQLIEQYDSKILFSQEYYQCSLTGVNTSVVISTSDCKLWADLLKYYSMNMFIDTLEPKTINERISLLLDQETAFQYKDKAQDLVYKGEGIHITPAKYLMLDTQEAYAVHHLAGTWKKKLSFARKTRRVIGVGVKRIIGKRGFERLWNKQKK